MAFAKNIRYPNLVNKTNDREKKTEELMNFIFCLTLFQGRISLSSPHQFGFVRCTKYSRFLFSFKNILFVRHLLSILFPIFCDFSFFVNCETVDGCLNFSQFFDIDGNSQVLVAFYKFFSVMPLCSEWWRAQSRDTVGT